MDRSYIHKIITQALKEDVADGDITTKGLIPPAQSSQAYIVFKEDGVICGLEIAKYVFKALDKNIQFTSSLKDGSRVTRDTRIAFLKGRTRTILAGERVALNFLSHLSGIATLTNQFVKKIRPSKAKILDTRKTTPLLRKLEKYAVRCGGGTNNRTNLNEMALIKDNHIAAARKTGMSLHEIIKTAKKKMSRKIEVEVTNLKEFKEALKANPDIILLDNMNVAVIKKAMHMAKGRRPLLEASGGINVNNVHRIAQTGVDRISVGALTHSAKAINLSLEIVP